MMKKIRIAIGDYQVAFARRDVYSRAEFRSGLAGGVDDKTRRENSAVSEARRPFSDRGDWLTLDDASSQRARFLQEEVRGAARVNDRISWHAQSACKRRAQMRLRISNLLRVEDFRVDAVLAVVIKFSADFAHFFFVGGNPERAAWVEFHGRWKLVAQIVPENLRIALRNRPSRRCGPWLRQWRQRSGSLRQLPGRANLRWRVPRRRRRRRCRRPRLRLLRVCSRVDAIPKGIAGVENQIRFRCDERGTFDNGQHLTIFNANLSFKDAAHDAFLAPDFAGFQFSVGVEAGKFGAGAGAAGRTVVGFSGAENKVLALNSGFAGGTE